MRVGSTLYESEAHLGNCHFLFPHYMLVRTLIGTVLCLVTLVSCVQRDSDVT